MLTSLLLRSILLFAVLPQSGGDSVAELVERIKGRADSAEPGWIDELAGKRSEESLAALIEVFDAMQSVYMRREVIRALASYDDSPDLGRRALEKLRDVTTTERVRQVRRLAMDAIAGCPNFGSHYLRSIVDSPVHPEVREWAMEHLVGAVRPADFDWYMSHYRPPQEDKEKGKKDEDAVPRAAPLAKLRELAFGAIAPKLEGEALVRALRDRNAAIRVQALQELESRDGDEVVEIAERFYGNASERPADRLVAAELLVRHLGPEIAARFVKDGPRKDTPNELAKGLAELLRGFSEPKVEKLLLKQVGKGKEQALLFSYWSTEHIQNEKVDKALLRGLKNKDAAISVEAARILADRGYGDAVEALEKQLGKAKEARTFAALCDAIGRLRGNDDAWAQRLVEYAGSEATEVRNGALEALGELERDEHVPLFVAAFGAEDWSTRLVAARALARNGSKECIGALCQQIRSENGRLEAEMGRMLFELTGKPFSNNGLAWSGWWEKEGAAFQKPTAKELREAKREDEKRRLRRTTISNFFGIEIESHHLVFIVDISGSMDFLTQGLVAGEKGRPRIDFAKEEIEKCLDGIDRNSFFNIFAFSDRIFPWSEEMRSLDGDSLQEAKEFVRGLRIGGGTNLFGALRRAFEDPDIDTIFLVSDGEPSLGDVTDPGTIRDTVSRWNEHRGVRIHSIAIGEDLRILEWLAEDTGGLYLEFR